MRNSSNELIKLTEALVEFGVIAIDVHVVKLAPIFSTRHVERNFPVP